MIVFGYVYHKRGTEDWYNIVGSLVEDWRVINGNISASAGKLGLTQELPHKNKDPKNRKYTE